MIQPAREDTRALGTFLVLGQAEEAVPTRDQNHVVIQVLPLDLQLLHNHHVSLEDVEHGIEGAGGAPWLVAKRVADAVDIPRRDSDHCLRA